MNIWAIHPHPCEDEVLSSWITRIAYAGQMKVKDFCKIALNAEVKHLTNIDCSINEELINTLSKGTGVPIDRILETSLLSEDRYVFVHSDYSPDSLIVPTKYKRKALNPGLNFCPRCLGEDIDPYFRKSWRFAFYPVCSTHKAILRQRCPKCMRPYQYLDSSRIGFGASTITICKHCGFDIRHSPIQVENSAINECTGTLQEALKEGIKSNSFNVPILGNVSSLHYLNLLLGVMSVCANPKFATWVVRNYPGDIPPGIENYLITITKGSRKLEQRSLMELNVIMSLATALLKDWPVRCEAFASAHGLSVGGLADWLPTPHDFNRFINHKRPDYKTSFSWEETYNARLILYRELGKLPSQRELKLFMSDGIVRFMPRKDCRSAEEILMSPELFALEAKTANHPDFNASRYIIARKKNSIEFKRLRKQSISHTSDKKRLSDELLQVDLFEGDK